MAIEKVDIFVKIDGIEGESEDSKHKNEIEVLGLSVGLTNTGTFVVAGGGGAKHSNFDDISFTKLIDKSSPKLLEACATGKHITTAVFTLRKAGQQGSPQEYTKITLTELLISAYHLSDGQGQDLPTEHVAINYTKIEFEYKPQTADGGLGGAVRGGYDIKKSVTV